MRDASSRFIEILDPKDTSRVTVWDLRLEDVLAHQEAIITRSRSSTQSSCGKESSPRWKRISSILTVRRGN